MIEKSRRKKIPAALNTKRRRNFLMSSIPKVGPAIRGTAPTFRKSSKNKTQAELIEAAIEKKYGKKKSVRKKIKRRMGGVIKKGFGKAIRGY